MHKGLLVSSTFLIVTLATSWATASRVHGTDVKVGSGIARSFADLDEQGVPQTLGIELTRTGLSGLPAHDHEYTLPMPASFKFPPYQHITLNWNPHGHFPDDVYGVPHFDFHFYFISERDRKKIRCSDNNNDPCTLLPQEEETPPFFVPSPTGVSKMGWHWVDSRSPELNGKPFTTTFIYGFYRAKLIFVEPMIASSYLSGTPAFSQDIEVPPIVRVTGYYPSAYSLSFDSVQDTLRVTLEKMNLRAATP